MVEKGLWRERRRKIARIYQRRQRRPCYGELIQIDGSPHDWFEARGPCCTLIVFIDDATSALMALRFAPAETTRAYMETLRDYLGNNGLPLALHSDRHSIFRVNNPEREGELTQFTRAVKTLGIAPIHANTPQAKGRVERANQTLQDRLVKELRLRNISDIETANSWLPEFVKAYNDRFASQPREGGNAHREIHHTPEELNYILSYQARRVLSKNLTFQYKTCAYQIRSEGQGYRLRHALVTVCENFQGEITVLHDSRELGCEGLSPYLLMTRRVFMSGLKMRVLTCVRSSMLNRQPIIRGIHAERKVCHLLNHRSYPERSLTGTNQDESGTDSFT